LTEPLELPELALKDETEGRNKNETLHGCKLRQWRGDKTGFFGGNCIISVKRQRHFRPHNPLPNLPLLVACFAAGCCCCHFLLHFLPAETMSCDSTTFAAASRVAHNYRSGGMRMGAAALPPAQD